LSVNPTQDLVTTWWNGFGGLHDPL
jgi:hypothetical protein